MDELTGIKQIAELGAYSVILVLFVLSFYKGSKFLIKFFDNFLNNHMKHMQDDMAGMHEKMGGIDKKIGKMVDLLESFIRISGKNK